MSSELLIELIGWTEFRAPESTPFLPEQRFRLLPDHPSGPHGERGGDGSDLCEFAGRACYQSWSKPNPATATNAGYLAHIIEIEHESVLEHATLTFYISGVSRSLTHELVRHRAGMAYSQLSQRYVDASKTDAVPPPDVVDDEDLMQVFNECVDAGQESYRRLRRMIKVKHPDWPKKRVEQAARSVLPNATETRIVVTGNYRAWRHVIGMRYHPAADLEIQAFAKEILRQCMIVAPNAFRDLDDALNIADQNGDAR